MATGSGVRGFRTRDLVMGYFFIHSRLLEMMRSTSSLMVRIWAMWATSPSVMRPLRRTLTCTRRLASRIRRVRSSFPPLMASMIFWLVVRRATRWVMVRLISSPSSPRGGRSASSRRSAAISSVSYSASASSGVGVMGSGSSDQARSRRPASTSAMISSRSRLTSSGMRRSTSYLYSLMRRLMV